ncbi:MAG TPA: hypothetical protein DCR78_19865 [Pseudomonas sp.]|uniref:hypothetical protein n=1 Tax=Stutzerimonas xanthomarina TaxID=271420 RepID=UPI000E9B864E|nr:hypothetical protein [Stutzerimonas xanthomarina]MBU0810605.1 hypothetical protein [Gammaproteobacteria bacterium]HAQ88676.1 hypothetical protein [Pseudomonas sp.]MBK3849668.1 DUF1643 domain-containing protein [Stutzerimonas xanthomarina]MBU0853298.1 hypothetical protein [Gammaproteobacteria bacterium]MBU1300365.1 hypothetical protein [Gammaproteobacteria bacterium]
MSATFEVTGLFYELSGYKCRKYLGIKRMDSLKGVPELMIVMMNPGSSYPLDGVYSNSLPTEAKPDNTQQQTMKVMDSGSIDYARILNLSDLRTPNSNTLYKFIKSGESNSVNHSIFTSTRKTELDQLVVKNVPVIFGLGVNSALAPLAKQAVESLSIETPLGLLKANSKYSYYHPLPRIYEKQMDWVKHVTSQLTSRLSAPGAQNKRAGY